MNERTAPDAARPSRRRLYIFAYLVFGLCLFLFFSASRYPWGEELGSLLEPMGLGLSYQGQTAAFPLGVTLQDVTLTARSPSGPTPIIRDATLWLYPRLLSLLWGKPGVRLSANFYGGRTIAVVYRGRNRVELTLTADKLDLKRCALAKMDGASAAGMLSGEAAVTIPTNVMQSSGTVHVAVNGLTISLGGGMPALRLGDLAAIIRINDGVVDVEHFECHGGDLHMQARGTMKLMPDWRMSPLDLRVRLDQVQHVAPQIDLLLGLLPHPPGPRPYFIRGPLLRPSIT